MQWRWWAAASCIPNNCTEDVCGFYANFENEIEYPDVTWTLDLCDSLSPASCTAPQMFQNCAGTAHMHASCVSHIGVAILVDAAIASHGTEMMPGLMIARAALCSVLYPYPNPGGILASELLVPFTWALVQTGLVTCNCAVFNEYVYQSSVSLYAHRLHSSASMCFLCFPSVAIGWNFIN